MPLKKLYGKYILDDEGEYDKNMPVKARWYYSVDCPPDSLELLPNEKNPTHYKLWVFDEKAWNPKWGVA